jgi:hypothetical protein
MDHWLSDRYPADEMFIDYVQRSDEFRGYLGERLLSHRTPPLGIHGVGLLALDPEQIYPVLVAMPELFGIPELRQPLLVGRIGESPFRGILEQSGLDIPHETLTIAIPPPEENYAKVQIEGHSEAGTLGIPVWLKDGQAGALTAGHVAREVGAVVTINDHIAGEVVYSNHRSKYLHPEAIADVAAILLYDGGAEAHGLPEIAGTGDAAELATVWPYNRSGIGKTGETIRLIHDRFAVDEQAAWADVFLVDAAISQGGDSGSIVINNENLVVGQVVGGHPPAYSVVQDINLLLADSDTRLRL